MSAHLVQTEAGLHIHRAEVVPFLADRELEEPPCAFAGSLFAGEQLLSRRAVAACVGPEAAAQVSKIDHAELFYGKHWKWRGEQFFTSAGVRVILDRLAETHGGAAVALRGLVRRLYDPALAVRSKRNRANGYVRDEEVAA